VVRSQQKKRLANDLTSS